MTHRKPWWWRLSVVGAVVLGVVIPASFRWSVLWIACNSTWQVYLEQGVMGGDDFPGPTYGPPIRPWHGLFLLRTSPPRHHHWVPLPLFQPFGRGATRFKFPLHLPLLACLAVLSIPPLIKRRRRKAGLCVTCAYDLTGNESGICPECGESISP